MQDVRKPRVPKARPRPLTPREVHQLLTTPTRHPHVVTWLQLGLLQGLRVHEAAKLRGEDLTEDTLFVIGKGAKPAELPTHPEIWRIAQSYPRQGLWFPSRNQPALPQGKRSVITAISRHFERAGVVGTSHRCRHTFATRLLREGVNIRVVQDLMRHSALSSTAAYLAVDADERVAAIRLLGA
ncbi:site-specific integrase [Luteipulveratus sp. YIM 133132]|uniref:tyrosine-type recombinase/integrase n=1 Tax=Luteipulveratus flavus TaxID=3031728 RepID=UPI0023B15BED|nr:site-specific integrase [Luteipulveratus sp. YIM 133132]MDE9365978.1 site-specific integrase [Luteipulveratus sp. YIM 133132]